MQQESINSVTRALNDAGVPYIIVGGLAVLAHGIARHTQDVDIVVRLEPVAIRRAFAALASLGYHPTVPVTADGFADPSQRARWITEKGMKVLGFVSDRHRLTPVDVFVDEPFDFKTEYDSAMVADIAPGVPVRIVRLETLISLKQAAGRPRDLGDVAELKQLQQDQLDD